PGAWNTTSSASTAANPSRSCALNVLVPCSNVSRTVVGMRAGSRSQGSFATGWSPWSFLVQQVSQLGATVDLQLDVRPSEVAFDSLERHVQLLSDLAIGVSLSRHAGHAGLASRQRFQAGPPLTTRTRSGCVELVAHACDQWPGAAAGRQVECPRK